MLGLGWGGGGGYRAGAESYVTLITKRISCLACLGGREPSKEINTFLYAQFLTRCSLREVFSEMLILYMSPPQTG